MYANLFDKLLRYSHILPVVLIVEDHVDTRNMIKMLVRSHGYEVIEAKDGFEAIEKAKAHFPDLILMDLSMPLINGFTATQKIRSIKGFDKIPIIALTAYAEFKRQSAVEAGCDEVIGKPLDFYELEQVLKKHLKV